MSLPLRNGTASNPSGRSFFVRRRPIFPQPNDELPMRATTGVESQEHSTIERQRSKRCRGVVDEADRRRRPAREQEKCVYLLQTW